MEALFNPPKDDELFNDVHYWNMPSDVTNHSLDIKLDEIPNPTTDVEGRVGSISKVAPDS